MKKVLIVVDMLKDFIYPDGALYCGDTALAIVQPVVERINKYRKEHRPIIFLADSHAKDDKEFDKFPKHCVAGTVGAEIIDEIVPFDINIKKTRYSGFYNTELDFHLQRIFGAKPAEDDVVEVCGVCTSICVMDTVGGLANRDFKVQIHKNCVADFDPEMHEFALKRMEKLYGVEYV